MKSELCAIRSNSWPARADTLIWDISQKSELACAGHEFECETLEISPYILTLSSVRVQPLCYRLSVLLSELGTIKWQLMDWFCTGPATILIYWYWMILIFTTYWLPFHATILIYWALSCLCHVLSIFLPTFLVWKGSLRHHFCWVVPNGTTIGGQSTVCS